MRTEYQESHPLRLRHRIFQAGWWAAGGFVLDKAIAAIQLVVVARLLTPADFGNGSFGGHRLGIRDDQ
jgi:hypothetical protein